MSSWIESKYVNFLSGRLSGFTRKSINLWNFRCPLCNDSEKNRSKMRGYIYERDGSLWFHCHNCGETKSFVNFLKKIDERLYLEMKQEQMGKPSQPDKEYLKSKKLVIYDDAMFKKLQKISQLKHDHYAKQFVVKRQIPNPYHTKLYHCDKFFAFVNSIIPDKFSEDTLQTAEHPRLIIPFYDKNKKIHAFQGRSYDLNAKNGNNKEKSVKYISIIINESVPKLYGLDTVDMRKSVPVFEGPIDAMFIENSVATAGGDLAATIYQYPDYRDNFILVYDNEPRSPETNKKIKKVIDQGYQVCIWPEHIEHKDVNDMIKAGYSAHQVQQIIYTNTFKGLVAKLKQSLWSRV